MSDINVQQVLAQMRVMEAQAKSTISPEAMALHEVKPGEKTDFSQILANSINAVNENSLNASKMARAFEQGDSSISMAQLMVTMEKSSVSFEAMKQVRNKLLSAYQEIMRMSV